MAKRLRGRDLRVARRRAGLSQMQIATALGVNHTLISALETETTGEFPSPEFAERFMTVCDEAAVA